MPLDQTVHATAKRHWNLFRRSERIHCIMLLHTGLSRVGTEMRSTSTATGRKRPPFVVLGALSTAVIDGEELASVCSPGGASEEDDRSKMTGIGAADTLVFWRLSCGAFPYRQASA